MRRPTVLHVVERWGYPSEGFVSDLLRSVTATRPVVATLTGRQGAATTEPVRVVDLSRGPRVLPPHAAIAAAAATVRADVVHAHFGQTANLAWRAARRLGLPLAVSVHGWDVLVAARQDPGIVEALTAADLVVVPSEFLAGTVTELGVTRDSVRVVPSGLDLATLPWRERGPVDGPPLVTFAGRFSPKKGVLDVVRALAAASAARPLQARFVGFGPQEQQLRDLVQRLDLDAEVVDGRPAGAVRRALALTDLVVTASRTAPDGDAESLCLVNLEAQACGAPLVTTRHGGIPEAVDPGAALLVDEADDVTVPLCEAVTSLLDDPQRWPSMSRAGRRFVAERFELGARAADMDALWLALARGARRSQLPDLSGVADLGARTSVVIVTHNRRRLLERTLDALAAQTRPADEVLVVDNGSDDGTAELLAERVARQSPPGLQVVERSANLPVAEGRNLAVGRTTGDVVAFTDDDCRPRPTWLEALLAGFRPGVGIVQGRTIGDPAQPLHPLSRAQWTPREYGLYETCNIAYRRSALLRAGEPPQGPFDLGFAGDVAAAVAPRWAHLPFGEDCELAWRVKRTGVCSRFATHAVVDHEVFPPDPGELLRRAELSTAFPALVQRVPELRETFLLGGLLLGPHRLRWWAAAAGVTGAAVTRRPGWLVAALPYAWTSVGGRRLLRPGGRRTRVLATPVLLRRDLAETVALVRGSRRTRTPVL